MIGTGSHTVPTAKATGIDLTDDAGFTAVIGCCGRANGYAGRMSLVLSGTVLTWARKVAHFGLGEFLAVGDFIDLHPGDAQAFISFIIPKWYIVFGKAGHHTGAATGALVQVNDHTIALGFVLCLRLFHQNLILAV